MYLTPEKFLTPITSLNILHSVGANATHGLRRKNTDQRRAVMTLLQDQEWSQWSDRQIAQ